MAELDGSFLVISWNGTELAYQDSYDISIENEKTRKASNARRLNSYVYGLQDQTMSISGLLADENISLLESAAENQETVELQEISENSGSPVLRRTWKAIIDSLTETARNQNFATFNVQLTLIEKT